MEQSSQVQSSFMDILHSIGNPQTPGKAVLDAIRSRERTEIEPLRRDQVERNITRPDLLIEKSRHEPERRMHLDATLVKQIEDEFRDIDREYTIQVFNGRKCEYSQFIELVRTHDQQKFQCIRTIPHFERLYQNALSNLPEKVFRVVDFKSAGKVFVDADGFHNFCSQAYTQHETSSDFADFKLEDIREQIGSHVSGQKFVNGTQFASHLISTAGSLDHALSRANLSSDPDVAIYVIDTRTLRFPVVVFLMHAAIRAYNVRAWKSDFRMAFADYGTKDEWVFWNSIVASNVEKISYRSLVDPPRINKHKLSVGLRTLLPQMMNAGKQNTNKGRRESRPDRHARTYTSRLYEEVQNEVVVRTPQGHRVTALLKVSDSMQRDKRTTIDTKHLRNVWDLVKCYDNRNLMFTWILSLMRGTYYIDSIVDGIVRGYPLVIQEGLELVTYHKDVDESDGSMFVFQMPLNDKSISIDMREYCDMMLACVKAWYLCGGHTFCCGSPFYVVMGADRPPSNLLRLCQDGLQGKCKTKPLSADTQIYNVRSLDRITKASKRVMLDDNAVEHLDTKLEPLREPKVTSSTTSFPTRISKSSLQAKTGRGIITKASKQRVIAHVSPDAARGLVPNEPPASNCGGSSPGERPSRI